MRLNQLQTEELRRVSAVMDKNNVMIHWLFCNNPLVMLHKTNGYKNQSMVPIIKC